MCFLFDTFKERALIVAETPLSYSTQNASPHQAKVIDLNLWNNLAALFTERNPPPCDSLEGTQYHPPSITNRSSPQSHWKKCTQLSRGEHRHDSINRSGSPIRCWSALLERPPSKQNISYISASLERFAPTRTRRRWFEVFYAESLTATIDRYWFWGKT